jgi:ribose 1,5-bisphosphokinase PhnN
MPPSTLATLEFDLRKSTGRTRKASPSRNLASLGRLVLVVGSDLAGLAMLLDAARRRFLSVPTIAFPTIVTTRRTSDGAHQIALSRRDFNDVAASGGFLATWQTADAMGALPIGARDALLAGISLVVGLPHEDIRDGFGAEQRPWPSVSILRVTAHTDLARGPLARRACLTRMLGAEVPTFRRGYRIANGPETCVHLAGSIGTAVSDITDAIAKILGQPASILAHPVVNRTQHASKHKQRPQRCKTTSID